MKAGTLVRLADGREGRVVYHHLDGTGIKLDIPPLTDADIKSLNEFEAGDEWKPDVMLREPYSRAWTECCPDYEVIEAPELFPGTNAALDRISIRKEPTP